jgi:hypothetical protein
VTAQLFDDRSAVSDVAFGTVQTYPESISARLNFHAAEINLIHQLASDPSHAVLAPL